MAARREGGSYDAFGTWTTDAQWRAAGRLARRAPSLLARWGLVALAAVLLLNLLAYLAGYGGF